MKALVGGSLWLAGVAAFVFLEPSVPDAILLGLTMVLGFFALASA